MNQAFLILWIAVVGQLAVWTFLPPKPPPAAPLRDAALIAADDEPQGYARARQREGALKVLDQAWSSWCSTSGRARLVASLGEYYFHRQNQAERYAEIYGAPGATFVAAKWNTAEDQRIDRLTRQAYGNGYFTAEEFAGDHSTAARLIHAVVKNERVTGRGCAAAG